MPLSVTPIPSDGEIIVFGNFENRAEAIIFADRSASRIVHGAPASWGFGFDVSTTRVANFLSTGAVFNDDAADLDFRVEGDNNANLLVIDAGTDSGSFGGAVVTGAAYAFNNLTSRALTTSIGREIHMPAQTLLVTNASGTVAVGAAVFLGIPTLDQCPASGTDLTVTEGATLYIAGALAGTACAVVVTAGHAIWVDAGSVRIDGTLQLGNAGTDTGAFAMEGATSGVVTTNVAAAAGTYTQTLPSAMGTCGQQLTTNGASPAILSWAAASWKELKDIQGLTCRDQAYRNVREARVYDYTYKPCLEERGMWSGGGMTMTGILADDAPWAMQGRCKGAFSPINSVGNLIAAFQVMAEKVEKLEAASVG